MGQFHCDRCQKSLLVTENVRYKVTIQVESAYDPLELTKNDIEQKNHQDVLQAILKSIEGRSAEELEAEIYKSFKFDLCLACQREYIRNPLGLSSPEYSQDSQNLKETGDGPTAPQDHP
ncbi:MAG: hypothetical protein P1V97_22250 [Planctomycetota bacterium]|nr:hypothetical protein [Planctomycetota bacterium]